MSASGSGAGPRIPTTASGPRPRSPLATEYRARLRTLLAHVQDLEDEALARIVDELRRLKTALVEWLARAGVRAGVAGTAAALDVQAVVQEITARVNEFAARLGGIAVAAASRAVHAGALMVDGVLKPALVAASAASASAHEDRRRAPPPSSLQPGARAPTLPAPPRGFGPGPTLQPGGPFPGLHAPPASGRPGAPPSPPAPPRLPPIVLTPPAPGEGPGRLPGVSVRGIFPVIPDGLERATQELAAEEMTKLTTNLRQGMLAGVRRAALGGLSPSEAMKVVDQALPSTVRGPRLTEGIGASAERIVRTQVSRAFNIATNRRAKDLAAELAKLRGGAGGDAKRALVRKQWVATIDARTRPDHLAAHGQEVGIDEPFIVGGEQLDHPGDPAGSAAEVINCRCRVVTVLPENPEDLFA